MLLTIASTAVAFVMHKARYLEFKLFRSEAQVRRVMRKLQRNGTKIRTKPSAYYVKHGKLAEPSGTKAGTKRCVYYFLHVHCSPPPSQGSSQQLQLSWQSQPQLMQYGFFLNLFLPRAKWQLVECACDGRNALRRSDAFIALCSLACSRRSSYG